MKLLTIREKLFFCYALKTVNRHAYFSNFITSLYLVKTFVYNFGECSLFDMHIYQVERHNIFRGASSCYLYFSVIVNDINKNILPNCLSAPEDVLVQYNFSS